MIKPLFQGIRQEILRELSAAESNIIIAIYWFTNRDLFNMLYKKLEAGVSVELIIHNDFVNNRNAGLDFQRFIDKGGKFYFSDNESPMHNKFCVIDNATLINGSYNWTYFAESKNSENVLIIKEEEETIKAFIKEFELLKSRLEQIQKITQLSQHELNEFNGLNARNYLAYDIINMAKETGKKSLIKEAFELAPVNIEIQKKALKYNLIGRKRLKKSIGVQLKDDEYSVVIPAGSIIPLTYSKIVQTSADNQTKSHSAAYLGENQIASKNSKMKNLNLFGIPPKPAGKAKMKYIFSIDIHGKLRMKKYSLDNGKMIEREHDIAYFLEKID